MEQQSITIPLSSTLDLSTLLEIAHQLAEQLEDAIQDAGGDCEVEEGEVSVEYK